MACAIEADGVEVTLQVTGLGRGVENSAGGFIDAVDRCHFPGAAGELMDLAAVVGIKEDVAEALAALAGPEEAAAVVEEEGLTAGVDPVGIGLFQNGGVAAGFDVDGEELQVVLDAVGAHHEEAARAGHPAGASDQVRVAGVADIEPAGGAAGRGDDAEVYDGVVVAGLGVALGFVDAAQVEQVFVGIDRFAAGVELEVGDGMGIGRPPKAAGEADFLGVDPIGRAVAEGFAAVAGEAGFGFGGGVDGVEVPAAAEGDGFAVGREAGIHFAFGGFGELVNGGGVHVDQEEVAAGGIEQLLAVFGELEAARGHAGIAVAPLEGGTTGGWGNGAADGVGGDQRLGRPGGRVIDGEAAALAQDEAGAVGSPEGRHAGAASTAAPGLVEAVERDGLLLGQGTGDQEETDGKAAHGCDCKTRRG